MATKRSASLIIASVLVLLILCYTTLVIGGDSSSKYKRANGGGFSCVACVLITNLVEQYSVLHESSTEQAMKELCTFLPYSYEKDCDEFVNIFGGLIIELFAQDYTPDQVCGALNFCTDPQCALFPSKTTTPTSSTTSFNIPPEKIQFLLSQISLISDSYLHKSNKNHNHNNNNKHKKQQEPQEKVPYQYLPALDDDNDRFSTYPTARGSDWRGKDCDDLNSHIYPGQKSFPPPPYPNFNTSSDYNCNGIFGVNPQTNQTWKQTLCGPETGSIGAIVLGASAQAHFEIDPDWITAKKVNSTTYNNLPTALENELDWPHRSWMTGFETSVPWVDSIYLKLRSRNLCNHRDYQNLGVNGASSNDLVETVLDLARDQKLDNPALLVYATIGDDVCSPHHDLNHMTTVEQFKANVLNVTRYLNTVLPKGSHILYSGLVDGRILWNQMANRIHPIGGNRTYAEVYSWLACLEVNPCWGWLNVNETIRNETSKRAAQLSAVFPEFIAEYKGQFENFDMAYSPFPLAEVIEIAKKRGLTAEALIEPVDGFHPSQIGHYLIAQYLWEWLGMNYPSWIGPVNPNNALIQKMFGNQGGY